MTREQSKFLIELASIDKRIADWVFDEFERGCTLQQVKDRLKLFGNIAGRE